jgi:hypothetical protein
MPTAYLYHHTLCVVLFRSIYTKIRLLHLMHEKETCCKKQRHYLSNYKSGALELKGNFTRETVWATQAQIAEVFNIRPTAQIPASLLHLSNELSQTCF